MEYNSNMRSNLVTSTRSRLGAAALTFIMALTALVTFSAAPASAAPLPVFNNAELGDVTCVSSSDCWAVGKEAGANSTGVGLFVHFDGTSWSAVSSPTPAGNISLIINGIDCTAGDNCWAVGVDNFSGASNHVIEHWDGVSWSLSTPSTVQGYATRLIGVYCVSASDCWAVGDSNTHSFVQHFDGTTWSTVAAPDGFFRTVNCPASNNCWAGGDGTTPLIHWDGTSWSADPSFGAGSAPQVIDVTCLSTTDCWLYDRDTYHYDGTSWTLALATSDILTGLGVTDTTGTSFAHVSCGSSTDCWVVTVGASAAPLSAHYDGSGWAYSNTITPGAFNNVEGLDCSQGTCIAVGSSSLTNASPANSLIEHTDSGGAPMFSSAFRSAAFSTPITPHWVLDKTPGVWSFVPLPSPVSLSVTTPDAGFNAPVAYVATLDVKTPVKGTVTFSDNGVVFRTVTVPAGALKATALGHRPTVGAHSITATYAPAPPYLAVTSSVVTQTISTAPTATTVTQVVGLHYTTYTVRAKRIAPSVGYPAGGTFTISLNGVSFITIPASVYGSARFTLPNNTAVVTATYSGSATDSPS